MPEKDTSNLPILDDIIVPGDAEKAVPTPSSTVQSSLLAVDENAAPAATLDTLPSASEWEPSNHDIAGDTTYPIAESEDRDANTNAYAPHTAVTLEAQTQTVDHRPSSPPLSTEVEPASLQAPNIDVLTDEILRSLMPAVEQLLSQKIRMTLQQHLTTETED